ncbi:MAG: NAD-dependent isocitrate dehydrogenase [Bacteroidetes bacterium]|nr:NAD-dependent isocitrate dehydrogenase [Bacteroidota bacterium]
MKHTVVVIPGDGIGPDITAAARKVVDATGVEIEWVEFQAGVKAMEASGTPLPEEVIDAIKEHQVALKGPLTTPVGTGFKSINVALRREFDLYQNIRPAKSFEGVRSLYHNLDMVIFRENTEGLYSGLEHYIDSRRSAAEMIGIVTKAGCERIVRAAFEWTARQGRKKITAVHKANILKFTSGMFLDISRRVAKEYPDILFEDKIIDNMCMQMVMNPHQFDVIVTTNLFGDILSDLASGLVGGLGLAPGANIGNEHAIFEAVHGSAPDIAGMNIANPSALILAAAMMLDHLGEMDAARKVERAVANVIHDSNAVTRDLNPVNFVGTDEMASHIVEEMARLS